MDIDWDSSQGALLINPRMPSEQAAAVKQLPREGEFDDKIWLMTSGSTSQHLNELKCVALSKSAFLSCAAAVNEHLQSSHNDVWLSPLPLFHVGGLAVYARGFLSRATVILYDQPWQPLTYVAAMQQHRVTLSSLVPTQIFDLVTASLSPPPSLRAVIVGGAYLDQNLYRRAIALGWPVLPSYGLTEAASQVATASLGSHITMEPKLKILSHIQVALSPSQHIMLKGPSLLSYYAFIHGDSCEIKDPKLEGWLTTEDRGVIQGDELIIQGRAKDFIKIGGESTNVFFLEELFKAVKSQKKLPHDTALVAIPDWRLGHVIHLAVTGGPSPQLDEVVSAFHQQVMPFEKIRKIHYLTHLPRSPLNKLLQGELLQLLSS